MVDINFVFNFCTTGIITTIYFLFPYSLRFMILSHTFLSLLSLLYLLSILFIFYFIALFILVCVKEWKLNEFGYLYLYLYLNCKSNHEFFSSLHFRPCSSTSSILHNTSTGYYYYRRHTRLFVIKRVSKSYLYTF